jgi:hypothetical protein
MAIATVHKLPEVEPVDPRSCILQAKGLLSALLRNLGGEVSSEQRPSDADVQCTIEAVSHLVADGVQAWPEKAVTTAGGMASNDHARTALRRALGSLRVIQSAAFIAAPDSISGEVEQALSDDELVNALWATRDFVERAEVATS